MLKLHLNDGLETLNLFLKKLSSHLDNPLTVQQINNITLALSQGVDGEEEDVELMLNVKGKKSKLILKANTQHYEGPFISMQTNNANLSQLLDKLLQNT